MTQCRFGFALQETQGAFVLPNNWVPLIGKEWVERGFAIQGHVCFGLMPEMMDTLFAWIGEQNQGRWASVVVDSEHEVIRVADVRVRRASFDLATGKPATCTLEFTGLKAETGPG